ncbi:glyoxal reductase-like isoform X2 [Tubulanus polymorphus]|uniref:glyoxal reductase-like isoform X2 n=1 Tax=Tubulanus polymorphus TaxID=672921 RepID=UPI003DA37DD0
MSTVKLNTGALMPIIGFGTFQIKGEAVKNCVKVALETGYRLIDTADVYRNEAEIGAALKEILTPESGLNRSDLFITSKLPPYSQGSASARNACLNSMKNLGVDYLDLYLIHWPGVKGLQLDDPRNSELRKQSWLELEKLHKEGLVKSIGVSNYMINHLQELFTYCTVKPAVNQCEHHPHLNQQKLIDFCKENDVYLQAYSSLGKGEQSLISEPLIREIASRINKTPAQVLLRWAVQNGTAVLPKSEKSDRIKENFDVFSFELSAEDFEKLNSLHKEVHYAWNPHTVV